MQILYWIHLKEALRFQTIIITMCTLTNNLNTISLIIDVQVNKAGQ